MDPITVAIASAIAAGATTGLNETVAQAIKDAYGALKRLITKKGVDVSDVERKPDSPAKRDSLAEDLKDKDAGTDAELLAATEALIAALREHAPEAAAAVGFQLDGVQAAGLQVGDVEATGDGVVVKNSSFGGEMTFGDIRAGVRDPGRP
jgi:hypothetical protein